MATGMDDPALANTRDRDRGLRLHHEAVHRQRGADRRQERALPAQARDREQRPARDARADRACANSGPGALGQAAEAFTGGDGAAPVTRGRVPRRGDRRPHRADERLLRDAGRQARRRRGVDPHREPDARRGQGGAPGPHPPAPRRAHPGRAPRDGASHRDRAPDPVGLRQRAARAGRDDRAHAPREVGRLRISARAGRQRDSRSTVRSRPSQTSSTPSPATVPTGRHSRSSRRWRSSARSAVGISTRGSSTSSSRTSTSSPSSACATRRRRTRSRHQAPHSAPRY